MTIATYSLSPNRRSNFTYNINEPIDLLHTQYYLVPPKNISAHNDILTKGYLKTYYVKNTPDADINATHLDYQNFSAIREAFKVFDIPPITDLVTMFHNDSDVNPFFLKFPNTNPYYLTPLEYEATQSIILLPGDTLIIKRFENVLKINIINAKLNAKSTEADADLNIAAAAIKANTLMRNHPEIFYTDWKLFLRVNGKMFDGRVAFFLPLLLMIGKKTNHHLSKVMNIITPPGKFNIEIFGNLNGFGMVKLGSFNPNNITT